jgi:hypothetical protein
MPSRDSIDNRAQTAPRPITDYGVPDLLTGSVSHTQRSVPIAARIHLQNKPRRCAGTTAPRRAKKFGPPLQPIHSRTHHSNP